MKKILFIGLVVFLYVTSAFGQDYVGTLNNATYKIRVPEDWNGVLLVYAHGYAYIERYNENQFDYSFADAAHGGETMENFLLSQGYALAGTTLSGSGWQVKEGTHELVSLAGYFNGLVEKPKRIILIGYSLGSLIALKSAEEVPLYDGIIAGCTVGAGTTGTFELVGTLALAYQTLFGWPEQWGKWYDVADDLTTDPGVEGDRNFNTDVFPVVFTQFINPENFPKFEFIRLLLNIPVEGFYEPPYWPFLHMFFATEGRAELEARAKGPVVQNSDHLYSLTETEKIYLSSMGLDADSVLATMNANTNIMMANPQRQYLEKYFDPSGEITKPLISIHADRDGLVSDYNESELKEIVSAAGKEDLLLQVFTHDAGHCTFTQEQFLQAIKAMENWLDTGTKPGAEFFPETAGFISGYAPGEWPVGKK